jgi:ABC-type antimicrobial peptide transport system permease subunit
MFLRRAFFTILIPILIGIFAGTLTYLVGMALGCLIAIVVAKVRGRGSYERIALEDDEEENDDFDGAKPSNEKEVYAELPQYEAPPVYEEAAEKEVVNQTV